MSKTRSSHVDDAHQAIQQLILLGELQPNNKLTERNLREKLKSPAGRKFTSRPIEKAVKLLIYEGLVQPLKDGDFVTHLEGNSLQVMLTSRLCIELSVVATVLQKYESDLSPLLNKLEPQQAALAQLATEHEVLRGRSLFQFLTTDLSFHLTLAELADYNGAKTIIERGYYGIWLARPRHDKLDNEDAAHISSEHQAILDAIRARNRDMAIMACRNHLYRSTARWLPKEVQHLEEHLNLLIHVAKQQVVPRPHIRGGRPSKIKRKG